MQLFDLRFDGKKDLLEFLTDFFCFVRDSAPFVFCRGSHHLTLLMTRTMSVNRGHIFWIHRTDGDGAGTSSSRY